MKIIAEHAHKHRTSVEAKITLEAAEWKSLLEEMVEKEICPEFVLALEKTVLPILESIYSRIETSDSDSKMVTGGKGIGGE